MTTTMTLYNGSSLCRECGRLTTPLEAIMGDLCPVCQDRMVRQLIRNKMVDPQLNKPTQQQQSYE